MVQAGCLGSLGRRALAAAAASPGRGGSRRRRAPSAASLRCLGPQTGCTHSVERRLKAQPRASAAGWPDEGTSTARPSRRLDVKRVFLRFPPCFFYQRPAAAAPPPPSRAERLLIRVSLADDARRRRPGRPLPLSVGNSMRPLKLKLTRCLFRYVSPRVAAAREGRRASQLEPSPSRSGARGPSAEEGCLAPPPIPRMRPRRLGRWTARGARRTPFPGAAAAVMIETRGSRATSVAAAAVVIWGTGAPSG